VADNVTQSPRYGQGNAFHPRAPLSASGMSGRFMNCCTRDATAIAGSGTQSALVMMMPLRSTVGMATSSRVATKSSVAAS